MAKAGFYTKMPGKPTNFKNLTDTWPSKVFFLVYKVLNTVSEPRVINTTTGSNLHGFGIDLTGVMGNEEMADTCAEQLRLAGGAL